MSSAPTATCEECGHYSDITDAITGQTLMAEYDDKMLCACCRVDARLEDGDFSE